MPRDAQVVRQWQIWRLLARSSDPLSVEEIAQALEPDTASSRTIRRDLSVLREVGVPLHERPDGRNMRYTVFDDGPPLRLNGEALLSLRLALGLLRPFEGTLVGESLRHIATHIESRIPARTLDHFHGLVDDLVVHLPGTPSYADSRDVLSSLRAALATGRTVIIHYRGLDDSIASQREVDPQALVYGPRGLYLFAIDPDRGAEVRSFRVERIESAKEGDTPAERRSFDAEAYLSGSLGIFSPEHEPRVFRIRLHSSRVQRLLTENPWHESQHIEPGDNGTFVLSLELTSARELTSRVLALGADAEVLEPSGFRQEIRGHLQRSVERYRGPMGH